MAAVDTKSDVETIKHLDFEPDLRCSVRRPTVCAAAADFLMSCRNCPWSMLICQQHRSELEANARLANGVVCRLCRRVSSTLDAGVEFTPIGGRS